MKKYEPSLTWKFHLGIFFDRIRRRDLNGLQSLWVGLMILATAACLALVQSFFGSFLFWLAKMILYAVAIGLGAGLVCLIFWASFKGLKKASGPSLKFIKASSASLKPKKSLDVSSVLKKVSGAGSRLIKALSVSLKSKKAPDAGLKIKEAPGTKLLSIVEFLYSQKTVDEVFKPIIADWRTEYFDALKHTRTIKARWISVRYKYRFVLAMGIIKVYSFFRSIISAGR